MAEKKGVTGNQAVIVVAGLIFILAVVVFATEVGRKLLLQTVPDKFDKMLAGLNVK
ncbi:MAG: hypothetical protein SVQ76_01240 [Candidatus Nanohaloarchaea archaeon]|nr:hypothetical protein [Candidatus Nanohaloarchaea archaeon]